MKEYTTVASIHALKLLRFYKIRGNRLIQLPDVDLIEKIGEAAIVFSSVNCRHY